MEVRFAGSITRDSILYIIAFKRVYFFYLISEKKESSIVVLIYLKFDDRILGEISGLEV